MPAHTKLTPTVRKESLKLAALGVPFKVIAEAVGVSEQCFHKWRLKGRRGEQPYRDFSKALDAARARAVVHHVAIVQRAGSKFWQASAWFLERTRPDDFGRKDRVGLEPPRDGDGKPMRTKYVLEWGTMDSTPSKQPEPPDAEADDEDSDD